ncbi:MFS transporter [Nocardioides flavus (ex Wang et al. 2016)]|uniref:MFS transporter n=1 Tax=Nocardioides flavus (ex Wang et al. 2016) TaxID=2058780 RepID=A0ABQ3HHG7_9ACTN|nr:MFS transporter [Nocardioides flavus (ex Wang et al. 2016)]GHE16098.1 MFS transporter [Nocardioides flavus (ex Wang et al. 2016)]
MTTTLPTRSAFDEPLEAPPARWVGSLVMLNLGLMAGWFGPIQVLLAQQAARIAAEEPGGMSKEALLAVVLFSGAAVSMVANPVWGAFSDRTRSRLGRRVPWILGGVVLGAASLLLLSVAEGALWMVLAWSLVQLSLNAAWAGAVAAVPDQVPVERRGLMGGMVAIAGTVGVLLGIKIAEVTGSIAQGYLVIAVVMLLLSVPYLVGSRDIALPRDHEVTPLDWKQLVRSFWVSPRQHPDFAWAWITRLLVNLGNWIALNYLYYFLTDGLGYGDDDATARLGLLVLIYGGCTVATTVVVGHWSDRIGRRKVFVIWSGVLVGASSLILGLWQAWPGALVAAVVLGAGFGVYQAVDFALITQVLPGAGDRAKDLGVINIAAALPQVLAPAIAGLILVAVRELGGSVATYGESWSLGYGVVYGVGFALCVLGSVFVTRIRSVA